MDLNTDKGIVKSIRNFQKKWNAVKEMFLELSQEVTCKCFPKIFEQGSHMVKRLIWALLFIVFTALTFYILTQSIFNYFRQVFLFYVQFMSL